MKKVIFATLLGGFLGIFDGLTALFTQFTANDPQLVVDIDREQAKSLGMSLNDVTGAMQILLGSSYVNDFDFNNRSYRVYVQADQSFRSNPSDIERYPVRAADGRRGRCCIIPTAAASMPAAPIASNSPPPAFGSA